MESTVHLAPDIQDMSGFVQFVRDCNDRAAEETGQTPAALVRTFGCQQNVSDSEKLKGMLCEMGYALTDRVEEASLILYNTCAVRENAEDRIFGNVGALKHAKRRNPRLIVGLCGCMMQQRHIADKIRRSYSHVDLVFGTHALPQLPEHLYHILSGEGRVFSVEDADGRVVEGLPLRRDGAVKAWLPIMYGCDNFCTYCVVPYVRGRERSREPERILQEARDLVAEGYRDITLLGQNVNSYGKTLAQPVSFAALLRDIDAIPGQFRVRFMTSHPKDCTRELIDAIADCDSVCNHIHLPVQSGSNRILAAMNRSYTREEYLALIGYAKERIPGVTFTSDIIVGFPGEEEVDFLETLSLVEQVGYQSLYTFVYSKRVGTRAAELPDPVTREEKMKRFQRLIDIQHAIGHSYFEGLVGTVQRVLLDSPGREGERRVFGRTASNITVELPGSDKRIGSFVDARITRSNNWALEGEPV